MGKFLSWVEWHGPYRTRKGFQKAIVEAEADPSSKNGARLYLAVGRQKRISLAGSQILYIGQNGLNSSVAISERAIKSLFEEKRIRGWFNEYWFGVLVNSFMSLDKIVNNVVTADPDGARLVDQTEAALVFFADPLRNKDYVFPTAPFSFRVINQFKKPWRESIVPTSLERQLPRLIEHEHVQGKPAVFRFGSFSYRLSWSKKAKLEKRRPKRFRDRQESDCLRQRITDDEYTTEGHGG